MWRNTIFNSHLTLLCSPLTFKCQKPLTTKLLPHTHRLSIISDSRLILPMKIIAVYSEYPGYKKHIHGLGNYRFLQSLMDVCVCVCGVLIIMNVFCRLKDGNKFRLFMPRSLVHAALWPKNALCNIQ
jgi:hypothetical protein